MWPWTQAIFFSARVSSPNGSCRWPPTSAYREPQQVGPPVAVAEHEVDGPPGERPHGIGRFDIAAMDDDLHVAPPELVERALNPFDLVVRIADDAESHHRLREFHLTVRPSQVDIIRIRVGTNGTVNQGG